MMLLDWQTVKRARPDLWAIYRNMRPDGIKTPRAFYEEVARRAENVPGNPMWADRMIYRYLEK